MNVIEMPVKDGAEELRKIISEMKVKMPLMLELAEIKGQITRKKFVVLVVNGFTEEQAMQIVCAQPV